jgi:hypothetical protein
MFIVKLPLLWGTLGSMFQCSKQHGTLLNISEKNRPPPPLDADEKIGKIQTGILPSLSLSTPSVYGLRDHSCLMYFLQKVLECMLYTAIHGKYGL